MPEATCCPVCGRDLDADAPAGLCPDCLLREGLGEQEVPLAASAESPFAATTPQAGGFLPPAAESLAPHFPQLEIVDILGHGGMGAVYKARQKKLDRLVALKIIRPESAEDPAFAERFNREARLLARLNHPHIIGVHDFGEVKSVDPATGKARTLYYFLMEYVDGVNLRHLMERGEVHPQQALAIVPQICEALQFAHDEGIVHRDIKPENILLDRRGRVKIADFGLAKLASRSENDFTLTGTHQVMGTPRYMAPEQMAGSRSVDHRADIYSLGVVFYEMLTGEVPMGHFEPPSRRTGVDARLDDVVLRALAHDPAGRFQHASEMKLGVEAISRVGGSAESFAPARGERAGLSTLAEREALAAWKWVAGEVDSETSRAAGTSPEPVPFPGFLMFVLAVAGCLTVLAPWFEFAVPATARVDQYYEASRLAESASRIVYGTDLVSGIAVGVFFSLFALLLIMTPSRRAPGRLRSAVMTLLAVAVVVLTLVARQDAEVNSNVTVPFVAVEGAFAGADEMSAGEWSSHDAVELPPSSGDGHLQSRVPSASRPLQIRREKIRVRTVEHRTSYRFGFIGALAISIGLTVLSASGVRHAFAASAAGGELAAADSAGLSDEGDALSPGDRFEFARDHVDAPSLAMVIVGCLMIAGHLAAIGACLSEAVRGPFDDDTLGLFIPGLAVGVLMLLGGLHLRNLWSRGWAQVGALTGIVPLSAGLPITLPLGIWVLRGVLADPNVRRAFVDQKRARENASARSEAGLAQESAVSASFRIARWGDILILVAAVALVVAAGVGCWLAFSPTADLVESNARAMGLPSIIFTLTGMAFHYAAYGLLIGLAGVLLRSLRARLATLVLLVVVGIVLPAVVAVNAIMEPNAEQVIDHLPHVAPQGRGAIPVWPVMIVQWLGIPICLWVSHVLLGGEALEVYRQAERERRRQFLASPSSARPRLSRKAILGACWAPMTIAVPFAFVSFVPLNTGATVEAWQLPLVLIFGPLGAAAPIATTLLGWIALWDIGQSGGRIRGRAIAFFDAVCFPTVLSNGAVLALLMWSASRARADGGPVLVFFTPVLVLLLIVDAIVLRVLWVWVARQTATGSVQSAEAPPAPAKTTRPPSTLRRAWENWWADRDRWFTNFVQCLLVTFFFLCVVCYLSFHSSSGPGPEGDNFPQRHIVVEFGEPSPWFHFELHPRENTLFEWKINWFSSSSALMLLGYLAWCVHWQIEKTKSPTRPHWAGSPNAIVAWWALATVAAVLWGFYPLYSEIGRDTKMPDRRPNGASAQQMADYSLAAAGGRSRFSTNRCKSPRHGLVRMSTSPSPSTSPQTDSCVRRPRCTTCSVQFPPFPSAFSQTNQRRSPSVSGPPPEKMS